MKQPRKIFGEIPKISGPVRVMLQLYQSGKNKYVANFTVYGDPEMVTKVINDALENKFGVCKNAKRS